MGGKGGGGGGGTDFGKRSLPIPNMGWGMRRESAELWNTNSWGGVRWVGGEGGGGPTLEKEEGFQFQTSQGMNGKTGVPGRKKTQNNNQLVGCSGNYDINLDEGFTAIKAQENKTAPPPHPSPHKKRKKKEEKKRRKEETELHTLTYALTHTHTCIHALLQFYRRLQWRHRREWETKKKPTYSTAYLQPRKV